MDKEQVFSLLEDLNEKNNKIKEVKEKIEKKRKNVIVKEEISFDNIDDFISNNSENIAQLEKMGEAMKLLQEKYDSAFSEAKSIIFGYIFQETKRRVEEKKIYSKFKKRS